MKPKESRVKKKAIAAGHICLDITPVFPAQTARSVSELLQPGKLMQVGTADIHTGGSVANTGLGMKILGADVTLIGKIGSDAFGDIVYHALEAYDAAEGLLRSEKQTTSYSVVLAMPGIDRIFLHHSGANNAFYADDIPDTALREASLFHFGYPPLMRSMYQKDGSELVSLFQKAKRAGCVTSLDLAAVDPSSEAGKADWTRILQAVLPYVDFFLPSIEELAFMLNRPLWEVWRKKAGGRDMTEAVQMEEVRTLAESCLRFGAKAVVIKCGAPGIYYRTAGQAALAEITAKLELTPKDWSEKEGFEASYCPERVLSGTGAGDTSIAAFLTAALEGRPLESCIRLAAAEGACCVAAYDALSGLKPLDELQKRIDAGWEKSGCVKDKE